MSPEPTGSAPPEEETPRSARWLPPETFAGKRAVVTGGGTGLGLEISRGLAALGAEVVILSRNPDHHTGLREEAERRGWRVGAHAVDVREAPSVQAVAAQVLETGPVDILVNNAAGNFVCPAARMSANAWRAVLGIVLDGTFYCSREFGRAMIRRSSGSILNIVATYAWTGMAGVVHSASAKAGVLAMTKSLAAEWAPHGIRVNAIAPGPFRSEGADSNLWPAEGERSNLEHSVPLGRFGTADEIAAHCLYLLSPACEWTTGECLVADGGLSLPGSMFERGRRALRERTGEG